MPGLVAGIRISYPTVFSLQGEFSILSCACSELSGVRNLEHSLYLALKARVLKCEQCPRLTTFWRRVASGHNTEWLEILDTWLEAAPPLARLIKAEIVPVF